MVRNIISKYKNEIGIRKASQFDACHLGLILVQAQNDSIKTLSDTEHSLIQVTGKTQHTHRHGYFG